MNVALRKQLKGSWLDHAFQGVILLGYGLYTSMLVTTGTSYRLLSGHTAGMLPAVSAAFYLAAARALIVALIGGQRKKGAQKHSHLAGNIQTVVWYVLFWLPLVVGFGEGVFH